MAEDRLGQPDSKTLDAKAEDPMIVKYLSVLLICSGDVCSWKHGSEHDEQWQCLYEITDLRPKYYENKTLRFFDCKQITRYKHEERK